jgi:hypothetical protein
MSKKFTFFLFIFVLCCSFKQPNYCKISDVIYLNYNKELCVKKNLILVGKGGGMMDDVEKVSASYISFEKMNVEEVRRLYVEVSEGYISRYNKSEQIRPYLHNYPFKISNFDIMISFRDPTREGDRHRGEGFVTLVFNGKNDQIVYYAYNHENEDFIELHKEPYEVARAIVTREKQ